MKSAWEEGNPDLIKKIFTQNATYRVDPFTKKLIRGLRAITEYWAQVPKYQRNVRFVYGPVFHMGDSRWGAEWKASYTKIETRGRIQLRGVLFCELKGDKISSFWEYWHIRGGKPSF